MDFFRIPVFGFLLFISDQATALPDEFKTETVGYGNTHETVMRPRCDYPTVMAVRDMIVYSKKKSLGCPVSIQADSLYDPTCTQIQTGDCSLEFDLTKRDPYLECTGKIECDVGTDWQPMKEECGSSYMEHSHIMSMEYNCIEKESILKFNEIISGKDLTETYISNEEFPKAMTSSSGGTCLITSCSTGIVVGLIDLRLSSTGGICQQSLKVIDGGTTKVFDCNDNNNLQYQQGYMSVTSSLYVTLTVTSSTPDSFIWIDVSGDRMEVYCGVTEAFTPPTELDCTTTTVPTTTESGGVTMQPKPETTPSDDTTHSTEQPESTDQPQSTDQPVTGDSQTSESIVAILGLSFGLIGSLLGVISLLLLCLYKKNGARVGNGSTNSSLKNITNLKDAKTPRVENGQAPSSTNGGRDGNGSTSISLTCPEPTMTQRNDNLLQGGPLNTLRGEATRPDIGNLIPKANA